MSVRTQFEEFIGFAEKAGYTWASPEDGQPWGDEQDETLFSLTGDTPEFYCFRQDTDFTIRSYSGGYWLSLSLIVTDQLEDIEKYLSFTLGDKVRERGELPVIHLNTEPVLGDFLIGNGQENVKVSWEKDGTTRTIQTLTDLDATKFARYARFTAKEIRDSFLTTTDTPCSQPPEPPDQNLAKRS